jgi:hypothetical protein
MILAPNQLVVVVLVEQCLIAAIFAKFTESTEEYLSDSHCCFDY